MKKIILLLVSCFQFAFAQRQQLVFDIYPGQNNSVSSNPVIFGGSMCFSAYISGFGFELTSFDGINMPVCGKFNTNATRGITRKSNKYLNNTIYIS